MAEAYRCDMRMAQGRTEQGAHLLTGTTRAAVERRRRLLSNGPPAQDSQQRELDYHAIKAYCAEQGHLIGD